MPLADPRRYGEGAVQSAASSSLLQFAGDPSESHALIVAVRDLAHAGCDAEIASALAAASSEAAYRGLWNAVCAAVERPAHGDTVSMRAFAIPWVIVCTGNTAGTTLSGVLPDVAKRTRVLEANGVFGTSRNLGLGNALVSIESLEALRPSEVLRLQDAPAVRDLPPSPIAVARGVEEVHLRFLLGASISPAHAPDVTETGANVGRWGAPALRAMAAQLASPGVQILPMARPPAGLLSATWRGRRAGVEAAFNLYMGTAVRRIRSVTGDPLATLSAHEGSEIRITLHTPLDDALTEGFRWPLHPADDLPEIERTIGAMIEECRIDAPQIVPGVLPARTSTGAVLYPVS